MSGVGELKVYRSPRPIRALAFVPLGLFFVVGLSMVTIGPSQHDWGAVPLGILVLLLAVLLGAVLVTNGLVVTASGLVYKNNLRRKVVSWAEVQSFDVGAGRSMMAYPTLVIRRNNGPPVITNLASFTSTFPARIADELKAWQTQLAPAV